VAEVSESALVDTDVFSFWLKGDTRGLPYASDAQGKTLFFSFMSVAEVKRWALSRAWGADKRYQLSAAIATYVVLPYDDALAEAWAEIANHRSKIGRPLDTGDCWIAATAVRHGMPLMTHNARHYADIRSLRLITLK
jgi:tRNA(fMet)-specific endonuclease VapC